MEKKTNKKALLIGILAAVVVLAAVLALVLTQCTGGAAEQTNAPSEQDPLLQEGYELYWNVDRKEYDGKSEAGLSSRKQAADGYFHVRFFKDGEMLELKVADRKLINSIDTMDLMGLVLDADGIVIDVIRADRMPLERVGWMFYVQSTGGNLIKLNSSRALNGLEVLLEVEDYTAIYDMTGLEGEVGRKVDMPAELDRVIAIADLQGRVTHVFVTDRSEFMFTQEGECQHCKQVVSWKKFTKTDAFPDLPGHYILQNDIKFKGRQVTLPEDASICVDLNGHTVSKTDGGRMIALFNPGVKFALMDSSEAQTGTLLVSGKGDQGLGVWLRYGEFHFYGGTIDATAANTRSGGAAVAADPNTFFYMYGGTIRGGNAPTEHNPENNSYSRGMGGAVLVAGKFVMHDGLIEGGKAIPILSYNEKGQPVNNRGYGGNLMVRGSAVVELRGGTIRNGYAGVSGGNIYVDGTSELLLMGTQIQGGHVDGRGCNGGSVYIGSKATAKMTGGSITGGYCFNEGGNVYCSGTFTMEGGYIGGGQVFTFGNGKVKDGCGSQNLFLVNGNLYMYGGTVAGGVHAIDTSATRICTVVLAGSPVIDGGENCEKNLTLNTNGDGVKLYVSQLSDYARIGVSSVGTFSEETQSENADNFFSDLGADVIHYNKRLAVGKLGCICGSEAHFGECDGKVYLWTPHNKNNTLPVTDGFWYLTQDVKLGGQQNIKGKQKIALDLNGYTVTTAEGSRAYALFDPEEPITLTLTDSSEEKTGTIKAVGKNVQAEGQCVWIRTAGQMLNLYDVTLDASQAITARQGAALYANAGTVVKMFAGRIVGGTAQAWLDEKTNTVKGGMGGNVYINGGFYMLGGTIQGGKALSAKDSKGVYTSGAGGNLVAGPKADMVLMGGSIEGGYASSTGGNIYINGSRIVHLQGTAVSAGVSGDSTLGITGAGGNISSTGSLMLEAGSVTGGVTNGNGGNIHITASGSLDVENGMISGGSAVRGGNLSVFGQMLLANGTVTGGNAQTGGNIFVYGGRAALKSGTVEKGTATENGGNIYLGKDGGELQINNTVTGGKAKNGGNLAMAQATMLDISGGSLVGGEAAENGGNIYTDGGELVVVSGTVFGGSAQNGGNIYLKNAYMSQAGGVIEGGKATVNGGNIYILAGATFAMDGGAVQNGTITRDGAANMDVRGNFILYNGTITGGTRVNDQGQPVASSDSKINLFAYKGQVDILGGKIDGGVMIYDPASRLSLDGKAVIDGQGKLPGLTLNNATIARNALEQGGKVVISNAAEGIIGQNACKTGLVSEAGLVVSAEADGKLYLRKHTHCTLCDQFDGLHTEGCEGVDKAQLLWDGGDITEDGIYCAHGDMTLEKTVMVTAADATILLDGTVTANKRAVHIQAGAKLTLLGGGTLQAKGINNESSATVVVDGKLDIKGVTLKQLSDTAVNVKNGGAVTVGTTGEVVMYSGTIEGGTVSNGGGSVFVSGGSFILKDGTIQGGSAAVGGNILVYGGSFTQEGGMVTGGTATSQGGNVSVSSGTYTLAGGSVENGCITVDGAGNVDVRSAGTLVVTGGTMKGGYRQGGNNEPKCNVFAVNGTVEVTGGNIEGGVTVYGGSGKLKVGKAAKIVSEGKAAADLLAGAQLMVTEPFEAGASVVISSKVNTKLAATADRAWKQYITSDKGLILSVETDGLYLRNHTHCATGCGLVDGNHAEGCGGYDVSGWTVWNGGDITENGNYCVHSTLTLTDTPKVTAADAKLMVAGTVSGKKRAFVVESGAKLTLMGSGIVEAKGVNNENAGVISVAGELIIDGVILQRVVDDAITVNNGGVLAVSGLVTMESGTIQGGKAKVGGNIYLNGGQFRQNGGMVTGGTATSQGGNVSVSSGTYTLADGSVENGCITVDGAGNVDVRSAGTLVVTGGTMKGGYRQGGNNEPKCNVFAVNGTVEVTGGNIEGGVTVYGGSGKLKVGKAAKIVSEGKAAADLLAGAQLMVTEPFETGASVVLSSKVNTKLAATGDRSWSSYITSDKGFKLTYEESGVYLRAADAHVHCLCGSTDGKHKEGCNGFDVVFNATSSFPTTSGTYYLDAELVKANGLKLGTSDGSANVAITLCLSGKEVTCDSGKARIALIWGGSSLTITDCGSGTIKPNAATGNGAIFHPAAGSTLKIYNGTLDASKLSTAANGVAIDNAGSTYIYGGTVYGGKTSKNGGSINNSGTLVVDGGTVCDGKANRGGNIYSTAGSVTLNGTIKNGWVDSDSANIDIRGGSLTISGGEIFGGNRYTNANYTAIHASSNGKRNIFTVNVPVTLTGGTIDGGVQLYKTSGGSVTVSGDVKIVATEAGKSSLSTSYVLTIAKPGMGANAQITISSAPAGAFAVAETGLTLTGDMAACFENASGVKATVENNQLLFK